MTCLRVVINPRLLFKVRGSSTSHESFLHSRYLSEMVSIKQTSQIYIAKKLFPWAHYVVIIMHWYFNTRYQTLERSIIKFSGNINPKLTTVEVSNNKLLLINCNFYNHYYFLFVMQKWLNTGLTINGKISQSISSLWFSSCFFTYLLSY